MSTVNRYYQRFSIYERFEHIVMLLSFTTLAVTGLPQKYPEAGVSQFIVGLLGGIELIRSIHHFAATLLMLGTVYHIVAVGYKIYVKRTQMSMLPGLQDAKDALQAFLYNIGIGKTRPQMGRFTFEEKAEYWALVWGTAIMAITGFMMWNPIATAKFLPGEAIPAAKAAHGAEAVLAVLAIIVWHMYAVHLKRFNKAMWTGKLTEEEMLHEHPLELADIKAGVHSQNPDPVVLKKRRAIYYPIAAIVAVALLGGIYAFVTLETTSITTIVPPRANTIPVYVPQTPTPAPTSAPTETPAAAPATLTWDAFAGPLFQQKCAACHGAAAMAGLNLSTYADALKGSANGPVIVPKDSANSKLIQVQTTGGHPGQLSPEELAQIKAWIDAGAVEK
jgi:formate dehydrogenase gamma subunit